MAIFNNNLLAGAGAQSGTTTYEIDQSIRFRDADEHFMYSPTPSSGKDFTTTATISLWFKLGNLGAAYLAGAFYGNNNRYNILAINSDGQLLEYDRVGGASTSNGTGTIGWTTTRVFRDPSAWYHAVFVWDTTNAVQSERFRLYINGVRETDFATEQALGASELVYWFGKSTPTTLGAYFTGTGYADTYYFDGYMAEMHGVDGTALDQNSFGEFNSSGIWVPKEYTGSHGTDGFYIKGADASALGTNSAANGNNFTLNAISSHDQMADSPTNNFCVLNPISKPSYGSYMNRNVTGVNLQVTENGDGAVQSYGYGTFAISSGKWYYEFYTNTYPSANAIAFGWIELDNAMTATDSGSSWKTPGMNQRHTSSSYSSWTWGLNNQTATGLSEFGQGVVIGVTTDFDNNTFTLTKDGSAYGSVDFDSVSPTYTLSGVEHLPLLFFGADGASLATLNFGQDSTFNGALSAGGNADGNGHGNFKYTVPTGALSICSRNLGS